MSALLSIHVAADAAGDRPAIITANRTWTFADCASAVLAHADEASLARVEGTLTPADAAPVAASPPLPSVNGEAFATHSRGSTMLAATGGTETGEDSVPFAEAGEDSVPFAEAGEDSVPFAETGGNSVPCTEAGEDSVSGRDASRVAGRHTLALVADPGSIERERGTIGASCDVVVATPSIETIVAVYAALKAERPIALLHPRTPAAELARQRAQVKAARLPPGSAIILFTSGSTARARGVVFSRDALVAAARASAARLAWYDDDRWLLCLPLAHAGGLSIVIRCLIERRPVVLLEADFDPDRVAALVRHARPTLASLVPTQLSALLDRSIDGLRAILIGGAPLVPVLRDAAIARGMPIRATYGLTETFGQVATAIDAHSLPHPLSSVTIAAPCEGGRIRIGGPMLATCYLDGAPIAPELLTSDLGTLEDGDLRVDGRIDDMIVTGGENVHPAQVEAVLASTPGVRAACAFAVPDARWGELVGVALAVEPAFDRAAALRLWHAALPPHARPRRLATTTALPLLPSGKLDRRAIASLPTAPLHYA